MPWRSEISKDAAVASRLPIQTMRAGYGRGVEVRMGIRA